MKKLSFFIYKAVVKSYNAISNILYGENGTSITETTWR